MFIYYISIVINQSKNKVRAINSFYNLPGNAQICFDIFIINMYPPLFDCARSSAG